MTLCSKRIRLPTGVSSSQVCTIDDKDYFIIAFGSLIRVLDDNFALFHSFLTPFCILKILVFQDHYFLIGRDKYLVYKGLNLVGEHNFTKGFLNISQIFLVKKSHLIFIHDMSYSLAQILNMRIIQDNSLTDSTFFTPLSADKVDDTVHILAKTYTKRYMISYNVEGGKFKCNRREIDNGLHVFNHFSQLLLLDEEGMWQFSVGQNKSDIRTLFKLDKRNPDSLVYIRDFGNYRISCVYNNPENTVIFFKNGEVMLLNQDLSYTVAGMLNSQITTVSKIGELYFCGSQCDSFLVKLLDRKMKVIRKFSGVADNFHVLENTFTASKLQENLLVNNYKSIKFVSKDCSFKIAHSIPVSRHNTLEEPMHLIIENLNRLKFGVKSIFCGGNVTLLSFESFSVVNGHPFDSVSNYYFFDSSRFFFNSIHGICYYDMHENSFYFLNIKNSIVKYFGRYAIIYSLSSLFLLNCDDLSLSELESAENSDGFEPATKKRPSSMCSFNSICDLCMHENCVFLIDFNENVYKIPLHRFSQKCTLVSFELTIAKDLCKTIDNKDILNKLEAVIGSLAEMEVQDATSSGRDCIMNVNGKLMHVWNGDIETILDLSEFIHDFTLFGTHIIVSASRPYVFNISDKSLDSIDADFSGTFVFQDRIFLSSHNKIFPFEIAPSEFIVRSKSIDIASHESLIYKCKNDVITCHRSVDQQTEIYQSKNLAANKDVQTFTVPGFLEFSRTYINKKLFCVGLINTETRESNIVFIGIKKTSNGLKLKQRKKVRCDIPLSMCCLGNLIAVICTDKIFIFKLRNGRIQLQGSIEDENNLCNNSFFLNKNTLFISQDSLSFKILNIKDKTIKEIKTKGQCLPFFIGEDGKSSQEMAENQLFGYAIANKIIFPNGEIDFIEDISNIIYNFTDSFIFGKNGSVFYIYKKENSEIGYIYDNRLNYCDVSEKLEEDSFV